MKRTKLKKGEHLLITNLAGCESCPTNGIHKIEKVDVANIFEIKLVGFPCWLDDSVVSWTKATKIVSRFYGRKI
jgi:hypothetical protein